MNTLQDHGIKAGAVLKAPEILSDPHYGARKFIDQTEHPDAGTHNHPGLPFKLSKSGTNQGQRAPMFAEHSDWIVMDLLSLCRDEIADLRRANTAPLEPVDRRY
jgi:formyl-CoA transferase